MVSAFKLMTDVQSVLTLQCLTGTLQILLWQPSQNVPAAGDFTTYHKMSSVYFPLKFIHLTTNTCTRSYPVPMPANPAILPTTQRHFEWAPLANARHFYSSIEYP